MLQDNNLQAVCSVTQMAAKLGLSRVRFYQLLKMGVFPKPVYLGNPERPFYPLELQQKCEEIRNTGIGYNGQPILFNNPLKDGSRKSQNRSDDKYQELANILRQMGLKVTLSKVKKAVKSVYPEGLTQLPVEDTVIRCLFRYFEQRL
jgi:hypothetical protein